MAGNIYKSKKNFYCFFKSQILTFRSFFQLVGDLSELREKDYTDLQHSPGTGRSVFHHYITKMTFFIQGSERVPCPA